MKSKYTYEMINTTKFNKSKLKSVNTHTPT